MDLKNHPQKLKEVYHAYCRYIAEGNIKFGFSYDLEIGNEILYVNHKIIENIIKTYAHYLNMGLLDKAKAVSMDKWFKVGRDVALGRIQRHAHTSAMLWQNIMKNMFREEYGWEGEIKTSTAERTAADDILDKMKAKQIEQKDIEITPIDENIGIDAETLDAIEQKMTAKNIFKKHGKGFDRTTKQKYTKAKRLRRERTPVEIAERYARRLERREARVAAYKEQMESQIKLLKANQ